MCYQRLFIYNSSNENISYISSSIIKQKTGLLNLADSATYQKPVRLWGYQEPLSTAIKTSGVRSIWLRNDLENFKKRLVALEKQVAENGIILTNEQVAALERKRHDDEACGKIETAHPGYLGPQGTFYVAGRIYRQTFFDTYSKVAFAKLYTTETPIT